MLRKKAIQIISNINIKIAEFFYRKQKYRKAVTYFERGYRYSKNERPLLKQILCLIHEEDYPVANTLLKNNTITKTNFFYYHYGFVLLKSRQYVQCLMNWDYVQCEDDKFLSQIECVYNLLYYDIIDQYNRKADPEDIYKKACFLYAFKKRDDIIPIIKESKYLYIEKLWKKNNYKLILRLIFKKPYDINANFLSVISKTLYQFSLINKRYYNNFSQYWLTALYNDIIFLSLASDPIHRVEIRNKLLEIGGNLINGQTCHNTDIIMEQWRVEINILNRLENSFNYDQGFFYCTPRFAEIFNQKKIVIAKLKESNLNENKEDYLELGAYYSSVSKYFFMFKTGDIENALSGINKINYNNLNEFEQYGISYIHYHYGLLCLKNTTYPDNNFIQSFMLLVRIVPEYDQYIADYFNQMDEINQLETIDSVLFEIRKMFTTKRLDQCHSTIMTRKAILLYNNQKIAIQKFNAAIAEALELYPQNELAKAELNESKKEKEISHLSEILSDQNMEKACSIAKLSEFEEVKNYFFDYVQRSLQSLDTIDDLTNEEKQNYYMDFINWCRMVDMNHPMIDDIELKRIKMKKKKKFIFKKKKKFFIKKFSPKL